MASTADEISQWQSRLTEAFRGPTGRVGDRLFAFDEAELAAQRQGIAEFKGYVTLADASFEFLIQSLEYLSRPAGVYHVVRVPVLVASVSRLRASYKLFWMGYFFDAASLLRGIFENAVHLCADAHGIESISSRFDGGGVNYNQSPLVVSKHLHKLRTARESAINAAMYGSKSGMSQVDQDEISMMVKLMHSHVHQTEMHVVHLIHGVVASKSPASPMPQWNDREASHYVLVSMFLAWTLARLMAYAVPNQQRSVEWVQRRDVLDDSLRFYFDDSSGPLAPALIRFIDAKYVFAGEWPAPPKSVIA